MLSLVKDRFSIVYTFILAYIFASALLRLGFFIYSWSTIDLSFGVILKIFSLGLFFDFGVALFSILPYLFYVFLTPKILIGSIFDKFLIYILLLLTFICTLFSLMGEVPFWEEFSSRYNFIAVDYLIYTFEVVENINQSYPLPVLISVLLLLCIAIFALLHRAKRFKYTFTDKLAFKRRFIHAVPLVFLSLLFVFFVKNDHAEFSSYTYVNELSKNGVYSFFAAYRSNELDFDTFYRTLDEDTSFGIIRNELLQSNQSFDSDDFHSLARTTVNEGVELKPNIILICLESFNADFMGVFGNNLALTPNLDRLTRESILFNNIYATGTRTVRGMEALTLSVPPTPGHSIVRRPNNDHLYSISSVLSQKNYELNFFYGGDGYFDNMNSFFGGQGFNIIDRNRRNPLSDKISTLRTNISDDEVTFENVWGVCDEDIYTKLLSECDKNYRLGNISFNFVMTTSNHKPYTFPDNKIDLKQGSREAAIKYTDFALGAFFDEAKTKPWFENTVFVVIADHCASSAGKWNITINKHRIPAFIYNMPNTNVEVISKLASQIDIMPTVFGYLNWDYDTSLYGLDINQMSKQHERALIGNYRTLGLLKQNLFTEINDREMVKQYSWDFDKHQMTPIETENDQLKNLTISYYQTASYRFKTNLMKEK